MYEGQKVQFDEPTYHGSMHNRNQRSGLTGFLIEKNIAKNEKQATYILLGILGLCIVVIAFYISTTAKPEVFTEEEIAILESGRPR
tara:strand:+ start:2514 stop:2771 length:258 start_codon:yes stop_codon:yes gene_type:complete